MDFSKFKSVMRSDINTKKLQALLHKRSAQHTSMLLLIATFSWPGWIFFDYILYPDIARYFMVGRIILGTSCLITYFLLRKNLISDSPAQYLLLIPAFLSVSLAVCYIPQGGLISFFIGATMILVAGFFFLIIPPTRLIVYGLMSIGSLLLFNELFGMHTFKLLIVNGGILYISIALFSMGLSYIHYRNAVKDLQQKLIIEESNEKLHQQQQLLSSHNELIEKQKEKLEVQNRDLKEAIQEREILIKEIHHRVKNNLQVVSSLLNLQLQNTKNRTSKEILYQSEQRIQTMSIIHESLYKTDSLSSLNLKDYLLYLSDYLKLSAKLGFTVNVVTTINPIILKIDKMVPLGLIFNELFSNALKHAFVGKKSGELTVTGQINKVAYLLSFKDNGVGFTHPNDPVSNKSLGLNLVSGLVKQLNGKVGFKNNNGAEVNISFPID